MQVPESVLDVTIDTHAMKAYPRRFSSGSVGWYHSGKVEIDGVRVQVSLSIIVIGSKPSDNDPTKDKTREVDMGGGVTLFSDREGVVPAPTGPAQVNNVPPAKRGGRRKKPDA